MPISKLTPDIAPGKQYYDKMPGPDEVAKKTNQVEDTAKESASDALKPEAEKVSQGVGGDKVNGDNAPAANFQEPTLPAAPPAGGQPAPAPAGGAKAGGAGTSGGMKRIVSSLKFWVQVDGIQVAGFSECSGLSVETEVFDYSEGGLNSYTHRLPVRTKYSNVTLKRGIDDAQDLHKWFMDSMNGNPAKRKTIAISVYDHDGKEVKKWELKGAYPVRWVGPDLRTDSGSTAIETLEFAHDGFSTK